MRLITHPPRSTIVRAGRACAVVVIMLGLVNVGIAEAGGPAPSKDPAPAAVRLAPIDPAAQEVLDSVGSVDVLVAYRVAAARQAALAGVRGIPGGLRSAAGRRAYTRGTAVAYGAVKKSAQARIGHGIRVLQEYEHLDLQFVHVPSAAAMTALRSDPAVAFVHENGASEALLAESLPLINQPAVAALGEVGADTAVAVLDTGVDYTRAVFGSCKTPGGSCKVAYAQDFAKDDKKRDVSPYHGTNVAGIVLGVAPQTKILALDVFNNKGVAMDNDISSAVEWVVARQADYNVKALNLSVGNNSKHTQECADSLLTGPFAEAATVGAIPVVAAGNGAYHNGVYESGVAWPACTPGAIRVGAVYDSNLGSQTWNKDNKAYRCTDSTTAADQIACGSQGGPLVSILAPGWTITAAGITMGGTSQAAPHVAGSIAVLASAYPAATNSQLTTALGSAGPGMIDPREGTLENPPPGGFLIVNRLDLFGSLEALRDAVAGRRVIGNGTIELGVNQMGDLNASDSTSGLTGLRYAPTGADALTPGCLCEGWGAGDPASGVSGYADQANGIASTMTLLGYTTTASTAVSRVRIGSQLEVTHDYHPTAATPNLYEVTVTIKNVGSDPIGDLRYRRVMDWDVPPTPFSEFVTLSTGGSPIVAFASDDGFAVPDPLGSQTSIMATGDVTDSGPADHGALFDLALGGVAPGATRTFTLYYGAAGTEANALAALDAVGAQAYSLGQPSTDLGPGFGVPNTFIFGIKA